LHGTVANLVLRVSECVKFSAGGCDVHIAELGKYNIVEFPTNWQSLKDECNVCSFGRDIRWCHKWLVLSTQF